MAHKNKTNYSPYKARQKEKGGSSAPRTLKGQHVKPEKIYSFDEANDRLFDIFRNHGFADYPHEKRAQLVKFYQLLMETQAHNNFTRLLKIRDVGIKHFIDCLLVPQLTNLKFPLMDLGTGPGFPGIPLKIEFPNEKIILAEGVQKRVEFLKKVREEMGLKKLDVIGRNINPSFLYPVQGVITRAVEDIGNTLSNVINSLQTGGRVYFMNGPGVYPEIPAAEKIHKEYYN
ncbi:MAG: 16S rRNA (guanine(527)-N(7))-methyltransferase RsmG, partial [Pseudobdellovibrionaceae bacterium]